MAHLQLNLCPRPGADPDLRALAFTLTALAAHHLRVDAAQVALRIQLASATQWFAGARSLAADGRASYQLQVDLPAASGLRSRAGFLAEVDAALRQALGPLHPSSATVLREAAAGCWAGTAPEVESAGDFRLHQLRQ
jgi:4-oxalocrotonate tautomerase